MQEHVLCGPGGISPLLLPQNIYPACIAYKCPSQRRPLTDRSELSYIVGSAIVP